MNAIVKTMFRSAEYRKAEQLARLCDYLRSKRSEVAAYMDDAMLIEDLTDPVSANRRALDLLDTIESMDMAQVGEFFVNNLLAAYEGKLK